MDEQGYIYATLKANTKKEIPTIGFISHYDTSPDCSGKDVILHLIGEIGVDGGFLRDAGIEVTEMNSGCICCRSGRKMRYVALARKQSSIGGLPTMVAA